MSLLLALQGGGGPATLTADLAATEAQDTAAFSTTLVHPVTFAVAEASDAAAFDAALAHAASFALTEGADVAAFGGALVHPTSFALTEAADIATFDASVLVTHTADLSATEGPDETAFDAALLHTADLAASEAPDVADFSADVQSSQAGIDRGLKFKSAKEQRYIYRKERIERRVPEPVAEAIERVVEHFEEAAEPSLAHAAALLALELDERGFKPAQSYTDILLAEIASLQEQEDDDDAITAVLFELLK